MAFDSDDRSVSAAVPNRSQWLSLALTALAALGVGFVVGLSLADGDVGQPPAIEMAREAGLALPIVQQPAFADGVITRAEVEAAIQRLSDCAESRGVTGFTTDLAGEGTDFQMEYLTGSQNTVELCRLQHFEATYTVWSRQEQSNN